MLKLGCVASLFIWNSDVETHVREATLLNLYSLRCSGRTIQFASQQLADETTEVEI
jgi:hypothetical protein